MLLSKTHKKLVLNLRDPSRVTSVMPSARLMEYKGQTLVAVPHKLDEVRVLRNLGFDPPAPMGAYYDWPGRYPPYMHQRATGEFLSTNPRAFCLNGMGCIAGDETVRVSRKGKSYETDLRTLHRKFHELPDKDTWKARSLKGDRFGMHRLLDVLYKGEKPTLRITLECGKTFRATPDHRIARPHGQWTEAGDLRVGDELVTNGTVTLVCQHCGVGREVSKYYAGSKRAQSKQCLSCKHAAHSERMARENNPAFRGEPFVDKDGYVRVWAPDHHRADNSGRVYEHILVAEAAFGVTITADFHVHHKNEVKSDNDPNNLEVLPAGEHHRTHDPLLKLDGAISGKGGTVVVLPKTSKVVSVEDGGVVDVYDLCMEAPHHNFVVNGVVVHNSGKTLSVLWAFDYLKKAGEVDWMVVVSPLSTLERAWGDEIFRHFPDLSFCVLHGSRDKRLKLLRNEFDIYIINHDGVKGKDVLAELVAKPGNGLVVVDEIAVARNASTELWKCLNTLINGNPKLGIEPKKWAWGLTGTPIPNSPTDAWAQVRLINPGRVGRYFGHFRDKVMKQITQFKWVPREGALDHVFEVMQPAIRFAREDCIDLPPTTVVTRQTELTPEQKTAFDTMLRKFRAEHDGGEITAVNEAVKLSKLLQICSGVAYGADDTEVVIPAKPRIELVRELIEEAEAKVLVFVPFTAALKVVATELSKDFTVEVVHGGVSKTQRDTIFKNFQQAKDPRVIVADARTMAHGITLTAANTVIWYAPPYSAEIYQQACARVTRPGQKLNTLIVNIQATPMETKVYDRLQGKERMQGLLLSMLKGT